MKKFIAVIILAFFTVTLFDSGTDALSKKKKKKRKEKRMERISDAIEYSQMAEADAQAKRGKKQGPPAKPDKSKKLDK